MEEREIRRQCQLATSPELFGRVCFIDLIRFDSWFSRDFELKERKLVVGIIFDRFREFSAYFRASLIQKFNDLAVFSSFSLYLSNIRRLPRLFSFSSLSTLAILQSTVNVRAIFRPEVRATRL